MIHNRTYNTKVLLLGSFGKWINGSKSVLSTPAIENRLCAYLRGTTILSRKVVLCDDFHSLISSR
jgi:hypothetical protein